MLLYISMQLTKQENQAKHYTTHYTLNTTNTLHYTLHITHYTTLHTYPPSLTLLISYILDNSPGKQNSPHAVSNDNTLY